MYWIFICTNSLSSNCLVCMLYIVGHRRTHLMRHNTPGFIDSLLRGSTLCISNGSWSHWSRVTAETAYCLLILTAHNWEYERNLKVLFSHKRAKRLCCCLCFACIYANVSQILPRECTPGVWSPPAVSIAQFKHSLSSLSRIYIRAWFSAIGSNVNSL